MPQHQTRARRRQCPLLAAGRHPGASFMLREVWDPLVCVSVLALCRPTTRLGLYLPSPPHQREGRFVLVSQMVLLESWWLSPKIACCEGLREECCELRCLISLEQTLPTAIQTGLQAGDKSLQISSHGPAVPCPLCMSGCWGIARSALGVPWPLIASGTLIFFDRLCGLAFVVWLLVGDSSFKMNPPKTGTKFDST